MLSVFQKGPTRLFLRPNHWRLSQIKVGRVPLDFKRLGYFSLKTVPIGVVKPKAPNSARLRQFHRNPQLGRFVSRHCPEAGPHILVSPKKAGRPF